MAPPPRLEIPLESLNQNPVSWTSHPLLQCGCAPDCEVSRYTLSVQDKKVVERVATRVWTNATGHAASHRLGTDEMEGTDYSGSHWYNMGRCQQGRARSHGHTLQAST